MGKKKGERGFEQGAENCVWKQGRASFISCIRTAREMKDGLV